MLHFGDTNEGPWHGGGIELRKWTPEQVILVQQAKDLGNRMVVPRSG